MRIAVVDDERPARSELKYLVEQCEPEAEIAPLSLGEYAREMTAPHRMDLMISAMTSAVTSMAGARTSMRMPIKVVICTEATSFVRRVTRLAVENRSMLAKENRCTCSYSARRSAAPKPMDALAASAAAPTPHASASSATMTAMPTQLKESAVYAPEK